MRTGIGTLSPKLLFNCGKQKRCPPTEKAVAELTALRTIMNAMRLSILRPQFLITLCTVT